jgi:outer membrane receptor protein involved in Fe transport
MRRFPRRGAFGGKVPLLALLLAAPVLAADEPATADAESADVEPALAVEEEVTVTGTRLYDVPDDRRRVPAHVTVIEHEEIERSGARTLQDLLTLEAGVVVFDQIGNDVQKSFDLRGFGGEAGTRVFLDGAPLNEPRNNSVPLELVPLQALDRVEITRGSVGALTGAGSEAGVINLWTRHGEGLGGSLSAAAGDFSTSELRGTVWNDAGDADFFLSGAAEETDGFRDNADGDLARFQGTLGWDLGPERRLSISLYDTAADYGSPGALTLPELDADREQAPFNQLDFIDEDLEQATLMLTSTLGVHSSISANLFARERDDETLTTGRAAPAFGGFATATATSVLGATVQLGYERDRDGQSPSRWTAGVEWLDGSTDADGISTSPADPGTVDPSGLFSDNTADRETLGVYLNNIWHPAADWTVLAGARWDDDSVGYDERFPDAGNDDHRGFSELSLRAGVTWAATDSSAIYLSYGEAFLPPAAEDLFSFPGFGSNPGLDPEDSRTWEAGYRHRFGGVDLDAALFRISSENEILFDPDSDLGMFGANVNGGETRRQGLELALRGRPARRLRPFATLTLQDAELRSGENFGNRLPLVPEERLTAGLDVDVTAGLALRAEGLHVGDQVLVNDEANQQQELDAYEVVNLRATWRPGAGAATAGGGRRGRGLLVFAEVRNAFDEEYATRGIHAFDFSTFVFDVFVTPAPGRRFLGGVGWEF